MIEETLEQKLMALVSAAMPGVAVYGFNQDVPAGDDDDHKPPFVEINASPKACETESLPIYTIDVSLDLAVSCAKDPRRVAFNGWKRSLTALIDAWNGGPDSSERAALQAALSDSGVYAVQGIKDTGGPKGAYDADKDFWTIGKTITVHVTV